MSYLKFTGTITEKVTLMAACLMYLNKAMLIYEREKEKRVSFHLLIY